MEKYLIVREKTLYDSEKALMMLLRLNFNKTALQMDGVDILKSNMDISMPEREQAGLYHRIYLGTELVLSLSKYHFNDYQFHVFKADSESSSFFRCNLVDTLDEAQLIYEVL